MWLNRSFFAGVFAAALLAVVVFLALRRLDAGPSGKAVAAPTQATEMLRDDVRRALAGDLTPSPRPSSAGEAPGAGPASPAAGLPIKGGPVPTALGKKVELLQRKAAAESRRGRNLSDLDKMLRPEFDSLLKEQKYSEAEALIDRALAYLDSDEHALQPSHP